MRTHLQVIEAAGGYQALAPALGLATSRVRFWQRRAWIPPEYWAQIANVGIATLDELAAAAEARRVAQEAPSQTGAAA